MGMGVEYKKKFSKKKYPTTGLMEAKADLTELSSLIETMRAELDLLKECVYNPSDEACVAPPEERTTTGTNEDLLFAASQYLNTGDRCGPQELTNCASTLNVVDTSVTAGTVTSNSATWLNAGSCIFTAPINGYYNVCYHARFKGGGNSNDVTVQAGGTTYAAAFGCRHQRLEINWSLFYCATYSQPASVCKCKTWWWK